MNESEMTVLIFKCVQKPTKTISGAFPLYLACERGNTKFVKLLQSRGASPNTGSGSTDKYPILHCRTLPLFIPVELVNGELHRAAETRCQR